MSETEGESSVRGLDEGKGPEWRTKVREWIYAKARTGEEFTAIDITNALDLPPEQVRALPATMHSAVVAGILVQTGKLRSGARTIKPEDWVSGDDSVKSRQGRVYRGSDKLVKKSGS